MSIIKAVPSDLVEVMYLLRVCSIEMNSMGCLYWNFFSQQIPELIHKGGLFRYMDNESTVGVIALNNKNADEYDAINWKYTQGKILPVRILVHPKWHNKGVGVNLLTFAEHYALENNYSSIRIDISTNNSYGFKLMDLAKYREAGELHLPFHSAPFICFEKEISNSKN
jgi:GNAT superfamily N-acetyltransferase